MIAYGKNIDTGKYHLMQLLTWTSVEFDEHPLDMLPPGAFFCGDFIIKEGCIEMIEPPIKVFRELRLE